MAKGHFDGQPLDCGMLEIRTQDNTEKFKTSIKTLLFQDTDGFLHKAYKFESHNQ